MKNYLIPKNISKPDLTIWIFTLFGIIEGLILAFITYNIVGLIPFPYFTLRLVFQISLTIVVFFFVAKGLFDYSLTEYIIIIAKYFINRGNHDYKRGFRLSIANKKATENFAQGFVIEEEIGREGLIKLKDGRYVAIVEIPPVNFFTKTEEEKRNLVSQFEHKLRVMPVKAQIVTYASPADPYDFINTIKTQSYKPENRLLKEEYDDYIRLCRSCISQLTLHQHYAIVFSSDALDKAYSTNEERMNALHRCATYFASEMNGSFIQDPDPDKFKAKINRFLYNVYNPNNIQPDAYDRRKEKVDKTFRVMSKKRNEKFDEDLVPIDYYLSPMCFDDKSSSRYLVVGENYYSFFYIEADSYPSEGIDEGWMATLPEEEGVDYHLFYEKIVDDSYLAKLNRKYNNTNKILGVQEKESILKTELSSISSSAYFLKKRMEEKDPPYYMGIMVSIHANNIDRLYSLEDYLLTTMKQSYITLKPCRFLEKEAYKATLLGNKVPNVLWKKMKQNVPASSLSALYPFAASKLADQSGAFIGTTIDAAAYIDLFNTICHSNGNLGVFAGSGSGKTYFLMALAERMRLSKDNVEVFVVLPTKGSEWNYFCKALNGNLIRINSTGGQTINIMDIFPQKVRADEQGSLLFKKVESIKAFVQFKMPNMDPEEEQILERCILDTYADFGITEDNESLWEDEEHTRAKKMPIMGDLSKRVDKYATKDPAAKALATILHTFTTGTLSYFNHETNADLSKGVTVFDLSDVSPQTKTISMFATTELIQSYFENDRSRLKMIVVDEVWMLLENEASAGVCIDWAKTIRGKGGSLCFATQELKDLSRARNGQTLCNQANTKILLGMNNEEAEVTKDLLFLTDSMCNALKGRERGQGIMLVNGNAIEVNILGTGHNTLTYTTDPKLMVIRSGLNTQDEWKLVAGLLDGMGKQVDTDKITRELEKFRQKKAERQAYRIENVADYGVLKEAPTKKVPNEEFMVEKTEPVIEKPIRQKPTAEIIEKPVRQPKTEPMIEKPTRPSKQAINIEKPVRQKGPVIEKPVRNPKPDAEYIIKPQRRKDE